MTGTGTISFILILINVLISYRGFKDRGFFSRYEFEVEKILLYKQYRRLVTSGFLHVSWMHLLFNMISLYFFSGLIEATLGPIKYLIIYFVSLVGGDLFALLIHRHDPGYVSVGASGAISGIMFASIALFPGLGIGFFFLPLSIPNWLFGILFMGFSIYGIKSNRQNIGHEAHLGGALIGMITALLMQPSALIGNWLVILVITLPAIVFIYLIMTRPGLLLVDNYFFKTHNDNYSIDHKYNQEKHNQQQEIDLILDKINRRGMSSLTRMEKEKLERYSRKMR